MVKSKLKKILAIMLVIIISLSAVSMSAAAAQNTMTVTQTKYSVTANGYTTTGEGFIMSDGSMAICMNKNAAVPGTGTSYSIGTIPADSNATYTDNGQTIPYSYAFKCFYYAYKNRAGLFNGDLSKISFVINCAVRNEFSYDKGYTDTNDYVRVTHWIRNWASQDEDSIGGKLKFRDGAVWLSATDTTAYRMAAYSSGNYQGLLTFTPNQGKTWQENGYIEIYKKSDEGKNLSGATFTIYKTDGSKLTTLGPTNDNGYAITSGGKENPSVPYGTYKIVETTFPENYTSSSQSSWTVSVNESTNGYAIITAINEAKKGVLEVIKTAEDNYVEGVAFSLTGTSAFGTEINMTAVTDSTGKAVFNGVPVGTNYTVSEVSTPSKYVVPESQIVAIEYGKTSSLTFHNQLKYWKLIIHKVDKDHQDKVSGDATLEGAVYGIYKDGVLLDKYTTDNTGSFTTKNYVTGDGYTYKEIKAPKGYTVDETHYPISCSNESQTTQYITHEKTIEEKAIPNSISISKFTDGSMDMANNFSIPEEGAEFIVYLKSLGSYEEALKDSRAVCDSCVVDESGNAVWISTNNYNSKELEYGTYVVHQVSSWEGRELTPDFEILIGSTEKEYSYALQNAIRKTTLEIQKYDSLTGELIIDSEAIFKIRNTDTGEYVKYTVVYPEVSESDEFSTVDGTLIIPVPICYGNYEIIEIKAPDGYVLNNTPISFVVDESTLEYSVVEIENTPTSVTLTKTDLTTGEPIEGAEIAIYDEEGNEVYKDITDENGEVNPMYLLVNTKYTFKETLAPDGYAINTSEFEFIINEDGTIEGDTEITDEYTKFLIQKVNDNDEPMAGVEFTVYDEDGNVVTTLTTNDKGEALFENFKMGKYTIKETKTLDGYDLAPDSIKIENDGTWDNAADTATVKVVNNKTVVPATPTQTSTGDSSTPTFFAIVAFISVCCIAAAETLRKKISFNN